MLTLIAGFRSYLYSTSMSGLSNQIRMAFLNELFVISLHQYSVYEITRCCIEGRPIEGGARKLGNVLPPRFIYGYTYATRLPWILIDWMRLRVYTPRSARLSLEIAVKRVVSKTVWLQNRHAVS
jgi:hypothetical protein